MLIVLFNFIYTSVVFHVLYIHNIYTKIINRNLDPMRNVSSHVDPTSACAGAAPDTAGETNIYIHCRSFILYLSSLKTYARSFYTLLK